MLRGQDRYALFGQPNNMSVDVATGTFRRTGRSSAEKRLNSVGVSGLEKPMAIAVKFENIS